MTVAGMSDNQGLHGHGVFLHEIGDTGIRIDYDFIGKAHMTSLVALFNTKKLFAE